jgi:hypothetical protein
VSFSADARKILVGLFGALNAGAGGFFLWEYLRPPAHTINPPVVYAFAGWIAVGMTMVAPSLILGTLKSLLSLLPSVKIGGGSTP